MEAWFRTIYRRISHNYRYETELERAIGDSRTVLDVGCGYPSPIRTFSKKFHSVGVDAFQPSIEKSRAEGIHNDYVNASVLEIGAKLNESSYDCVLACDLIEHLNKEDGWKLLKMGSAQESVRQRGFSGFCLSAGIGYSRHDARQRLDTGIGVAGLQGLPS